MKKFDSVPDEPRALILSLYLALARESCSRLAISSGFKPFCPRLEAPVRTLKIETFPLSCQTGTGPSLRACHRRNCSHPSLSNSACVRREKETEMGSENEVYT